MSDAKVKFGAEDTNLSSTLNKVQKELKQVETQSTETNSKFSAGFKGMAAAAAGVALGIGAIKLAFSAVQGTVAAFGDALDMGGRLSDLSGRTGETAGKLLLLERAFTNAGSSAEKVGPTINKLQKFLVDAGDATSKQRDALNKLGLSYADMVDKSPTEQLKSIAQALSGVDNDAKRGALAIEVFGKSGGELLPFLRSFSKELDNAKAELGSMARIMDEHSETFDTVSDTIQSVKEKFTEFAAGILSQVAPALELFTVALSRVDAAALGERLAKAFIGGQEAMNGFSASLQALKGGEFALSFEVAFASIKLQAKQTVNEMYKNFVAGFTSVASFISDVLGPYSAIYATIANAFVVLGKTLASSITSALIPVFESLPGIGNGIGESMRTALAGLDGDLARATKRMGVYSGMIKDDLIDAGKAFPQSFESAYNSTKPLMDLTDDLKNVAKLQDEINKKAPELTFNMMDEVKQLPLATWDMRNHLNDGAKAMKDAADHVKESLALSAQIIANIKAAEAKDNVDKGGRLEKKANEATAEGKFSKGKRIAERIERKEEAVSFKEAFKDKTGDKDKFGNLKNREFNRSVRDIAKGEGLDTSGKSNKELRESLRDIVKKRQEELRPGGGGKPGEKPGGGGDDKPDALLTVVQAIKSLVAKIEPKLPTHALGA